MAFANLPGRREKSAPTFDETRPGSLARFFSDLETLCENKGVHDSGDRKKAAVRYVETDIEDLWKTTAAWKDDTKTFQQFRDEVCKLYPGESSDQVYCIQDLDVVTGAFSRKGIGSAAALGEYYRKFLVVSRYLIEKGRLSTQEQSRFFFRGLQPSLEQQVRARLQQKFLDHLPDDPYDIEEIYDAIRHVLMGSTTLSWNPVSQSLQSPTSQGASSSPDSTTAKIEALTVAVCSLGDLVKNVVHNQVSPSGVKPRTGGPPASGANLTKSDRPCNFCNVAGHFIRDCEEVNKDIKAGKCKRDVNWRVVLPSGAMLPRGIPGACIREQIEEWHRRNPGQMAAQLFFEVTATATAPSGEAADRSSSHPTWFSEQPQPAGVYALNRRPRPLPEVVIDSQPPNKKRRVGQGDETRSEDARAVPTDKSKDKPPPTAQSRPHTLEDDGQVEPRGPVHPFGAVPDATNRRVPGTGQSGGAVRGLAPVKSGPAQPPKAAIHDPKIAGAIFDRTMDVPIVITQRELLSIAPEVRAQVAEVTIKKRVPREPLAQAMIEEIPGDDMEGILPDPGDRSTNTLQRADRQAAHMPAAFVVATRNATAAGDAEAYFGTTGQRQTDAPVTVAAESNALRAILPIVDGQDQVEAILDPGCQIVAMSEEVSTALALPYDPTIRLHMLSANGGVNQSLGLARNVAFRIGEITLYLQVHVLRKPAYDILLGRPFDVLTQSVVRNYINETQTVTIIDPNTGRQSTVPTIARGSFRFADRRNQPQKGSPDF
jgi:hypothetical protein